MNPLGSSDSASALFLLPQSPAFVPIVARPDIDFNISHCSWKFHSDDRPVGKRLPFAAEIEEAAKNHMAQPNRHHDNGCKINQANHGLAPRSDIVAQQLGPVAQT
jgi:hypothetical protein